ncbi:MAG TPA: SRPBCC family protein [Nitrospira sp.]|nr:SRPBCC family protein [Nitrospira sp.]
MLKIIALVIAVLIVGLLAYAATKPDIFRVQRSSSIKAPAEKIFALINDLRNFNSWNPYEKKDPNMKGNYGGPSSGKGAAYAFEGNKEVGKGSIEITEALPPHKVTMKLNMIHPFEARNIVEFTLQPNADGTNVTWSMYGPLPYIAKIVHLFVDMDNMVGKDFEAGLANLRQVAER